MTATCISSSLAMILMAFLANYPFALAPAMGHNVYFAFTVCGLATMGGFGYSWQQALGAVFIAGVLFILLSFVGLRQTVMDILPVSLRNVIPVGIGLLIALVGLEWAGIVKASPATYVTLGDLKSAPALLSLFGLGLISVLLVLNTNGAILIGILVSTAIGLLTGMIKYQGIVSAPPSVAPTFLKLQLNIFAEPKLLMAVAVFFFLDLFDTVGTLVGVGQQSGLMVNGKLPKARQALLSDAVATSTGALLGTSTVTTYIESASGISAGGRTGLTNIVTALLMLLALFFHPLIKTVGAGYPIGENMFLYLVIAPALIIAGSMMLRNVIYIDWDDVTESLPAFLTMLMVPL